MGLNQFDHLGEAAYELHPIVFIGLNGTVAALVAFIVCFIAYFFQHAATQSESDLAVEVAERRQAQEQLADNEAQLRIILDTCPIAFTASRPDGTVLLSNPAVSEMFGLAPDEVTSSNLASLYLDPSERPKIIARLQEEGAIRNREMGYRRPDGQIIWGLVSQQIAEFGGAPAVFGWLLDITERKQAEAAARAYQENLRRLVEDAALGVIVNKHDRILFANRAVYDIVGASASEDLGADFNIFSLILEEDEPILAERLERRAAGQDVSPSFEIRMRRLDGDVIWIQSQVQGIEWEGESAVLAWVTDITERKRADQELEQKEAQLRIILDTCPIAFTAARTDGTLLIANSFSQETFGISTDPDNPVKLGDLYVDPGARAGLIGELEEKGEFHNRQAAFRRPDGNVLQGLMSLRLVDEFDGEPAIFGWLLDATDRIEAEEQLEENRELLWSLADNIPEFISMKDPDGRFLFVNKVFEDWTGNKRDEVVGKTVYDIYSKELADRFTHIDDETIAAQAVTTREADVTYPDGAMRSVFNTRFPVITGSGKLLGLGNINFDITERKAAAQKLADALEQIEESVDYASNIQRATLPAPELLDLMCSDHFVIWEPRDVVGGDIYMCLPVEAGFLLLVADCTGHGVPGAFVTLVAASAARRAIAEHEDADPAKVIAQMNRHIKEVLGQYTEDSVSDDGLELGVCRIDPSTDQITYSSARFSLWVGRDGGMTEIKGQKTGVGYRDVPMNLELQNHTVEVSDGASFYLFSDGFSDQIGGDKRRALGKKRIISRLSELQDQPMAAQREEILSLFQAHQGNEPRRDDLTMLGFRM